MVENREGLGGLCIVYCGLPCIRCDRVRYQLARTHGASGSSGLGPSLLYNWETKRFQTSGNLSVVFINAGNRPTSVVSASVEFGKPTIVNSRKQCRGAFTCPRILI